MTMKKLSLVNMSITLGNSKWYGVHQEVYESLVQEGTNEGS